ncbi:MAG TPA: hypothetical protein VD993_13295 [Chitinophagaceae bacterium]|nr:hypothetical protein [Chitinophagaceae bacterium]
MPFKAGMYDVTQYVVNGNTIPPLLTDSLRWQNMVFDTYTSGSIATADTAFRRYTGGPISPIRWILLNIHSTFYAPGWIRYLLHPCITTLRMSPELHSGESVKAIHCILYWREARDIFNWRRNNLFG